MGFSYKIIGFSLGAFFLTLGAPHWSFATTDQAHLAAINEHCSTAGNPNTGPGHGYTAAFSSCRSACQAYMPTHSTGPTIGDIDNLCRNGNVCRDSISRITHVIDCVPRTAVTSTGGTPAAPGAPAPAETASALTPPTPGSTTPPAGQTDVAATGGTITPPAGSGSTPGIMPFDGGRPTSELLPFDSHAARTTPPSPADAVAGSRDQDTTVSGTTTAEVKPRSDLPPSYSTESTFLTREEVRGMTDQQLLNAHNENERDHANLSGTLETNQRQLTTLQNSREELDHTLRGTGEGLSTLERTAIKQERDQVARDIETNQASTARTEQALAANNRESAMVDREGRRRTTANDARNCVDRAAREACSPPPRGPGEPPAEPVPEWCHQLASLPNCRATEIMSESLAAVSTAARTTATFMTQRASQDAVYNTELARIRVQNGESAVSIQREAFNQRANASNKAGNATYTMGATQMASGAVLMGFAARHTRAARNLESEGANEDYGGAATAANHSAVGQEAMARSIAMLTEGGTSMLQASQMKAYASQMRAAADALQEPTQQGQLQVYDASALLPQVAVTAPDFSGAFAGQSDGVDAVPSTSDSLNGGLPGSDDMPVLGGGGPGNSGGLVGSAAPNAGQMVGRDPQSGGGGGGAPSAGGGGGGDSSQAGAGGGETSDKIAGNSFNGVQTSGGGLGMNTVGGNKKGSGTGDMDLGSLLAQFLPKKEGEENPNAAKSILDINGRNPASANAQNDDGSILGPNSNLFLRVSSTTQLYYKTGRIR